MHEKLQNLLPKYTVEPVTSVNLSEYEPVFYSNTEYYYLTDGRPATRKDIEDTVSMFASEDVHNIGVSESRSPAAFLNILEGYPARETLYVGLFLVNREFQRKSVGTTVMTALICAARDFNFKNLCLSVQSNNIGGLAFWKKLGFYETSSCACEGFDNLSMKYDL